MKKEAEYKFIIVLFSLMPISMIVGQAVSLINIVMISIFMIVKLVILKNYDFTKNLSFKLLLILYVYLLFNTLISLDAGFSFIRNFGFIRFIFLFVAINYFFFIYKNKYTFLKFWCFTILIVITDSYIEYFFGKNILGYGQDIYSDRIVSFFKDEPIVAGYLNGFFFLILGYLFNKINNQNKNLLNLLIILSLLYLVCVILTGERSNTIKAIIGLSVFYFLNNNFGLKKRIFVFLVLIVATTVLISNSNYLKYRYFDNIISPILNADKRENFLKENIYIKHYKSGYAVFKNNLLFGVGNKNYRIETRGENQYTKENYIPDTHPHQIYFELLSEHGLIGTTIILSLIFFLIFRNIKICIASKNSLQLGALIFLIINFLPLLPSGSFFSDLNMSLFIINLSIYIASNPSSNIFCKKIK